MVTVVTWWLLVVTACYRSLLLVPTYSMNVFSHVIPVPLQFHCLRCCSKPSHNFKFVYSLSFPCLYSFLFKYHVLSIFSRIFILVSFFVSSQNSVLFPVILAIFIILQNYAVLPFLRRCFDNSATFCFIGLGKSLLQYRIILSMIFIIREVLLVSLSTPQLVVRELTPTNIYFKNLF